MDVDLGASPYYADGPSACEAIAAAGSDACPSVGVAQRCEPPDASSSTSSSKSSSKSSSTSSSSRKSPRRHGRGVERHARDARLGVLDETRTRPLASRRWAIASRRARWSASRRRRAPLPRIDGARIGRPPRRGSSPRRTSVARRPTRAFEMGALRRVPRIRDGRRLCTVRRARERERERRRFESRNWTLASNRPSPTRAPSAGFSLARRGTPPRRAAGTASRLGPKRAGRARRERRDGSRRRLDANRRGGGGGVRGGGARRRRARARVRVRAASRPRGTASSDSDSERRRLLERREGDEDGRRLRRGREPSRIPGEGREGRDGKGEGKSGASRARETRESHRGGWQSGRARPRRGGGSARVGRTRGDAPGETARVGGHRRSRRRRVTVGNESTNGRTNEQTNERAGCRVQV